MYEELRDAGPTPFEIVAVAQDSAGLEAAGRFYEAAESTYTSLIDEHHLVSALYNMVNVPTGVMVDEEGRIVRLDEGTYSRKYTAGTFEFGTDDYVPMVRDWVMNGNDSRFVHTSDEMAERIARRSPDEIRAEAAFRLGLYFHDEGDGERADRYWLMAQELHPESWNYHRQDWSFTPSEAGPNWLKKVQELDGKPYYAPIETPDP